MTKINTTISIIILLYALVSPAGALANDGPELSVFSLLQKGQDVEIVLKSPDWAVEYDVQLVRTQDGSDVVVSEDATSEPYFTRSQDECAALGDNETYQYLCTTFPEECLDCDDDGDPECFGSTCDNCFVDELITDYLFRPDVCDAMPFLCADCDGDGTLECKLRCDTYSFYRIVDECVPPADTTYDLTGLGLSRDITVEDSGESCDPKDTSVDEPGADAEDSDDDSETPDNPEDFHTTDDGGSCSVVHLSGAHDTSLGILFGLFAKLIFDL
jgi:hypothetical protein